MLFKRVYFDVATADQAIKQLAAIIDYRRASGVPPAPNSFGCYFPEKNPKPGPPLPAMTELTTTTADGLHITVRLPDHHAWVREPLEKACAAEARRQLAATPAPDPAYAVPRAADLLDLHPETLRDYMRLPDHPRRLHYVPGGSSRGDRVLLSQLHNWQRRNRTDAALVAIPAPRVRGRRPHGQ